MMNVVTMSEDANSSGSSAKFVAGCRTALAYAVILVLLTFSVQALSLPIANANPLTEPVDTALVVSVDVSSSVDDRRYDLQLEGIATALEDPGVQDAILNGPRGAILLSVVTWSDRPSIDVPWTRIASREDARRYAALVRKVPRNKGNFTCLARMLKFVNDKVLAQVPVQAFRTVVDVSGDGKDNCNPARPVSAIRDEINSYGTTVNGLPILEGREAETLEGWYTENVQGGLGSFVLPALGFKDFGRAIRQKFVIEISRFWPATRAAEIKTETTKNR